MKLDSQLFAIDHAVDTGQQRGGEILASGTEPLRDFDAMGADCAGRIIELEIKADLADDALDALNRTIFRQQQQIDALQRELWTLRRQLQMIQPDAALTLSVRDELPPHY